MCKYLLGMCKGGGMAVGRIFTDEINYLPKNIKMGNLLYVIAVLLIIGWAIGFCAYGTGGLIHALHVIAIIAIVLRVIQGNKVI
jgi:hypothetical protein